MSQRREALIARYRVLSIERIRVLRSRLDGVASGNAEVLAEVRRELHTLKGDSHLLGFVRTGEVAHACEERLQDPLDLEAAAHEIGEALDAVRIALRDETTDRAVLDEGLKPILDALLAAAATKSGGAKTTPAAHEAQPAAPPAAPPEAAPAAPASMVAPTSPPPASPATPGSQSAAVASQPAPASQPTPASQPASPAAKPTAAPAKSPASPAAEAKPASGQTPPIQGESSRWIHVSAHDVDLVVERLSALHADLGRIHAALRSMASTSRDTMHDVERLRADLDEVVSLAWSLRLAPVYPTLAELGEHALELARAQGKQLHVRIDDGGALVERRLLDEVREPLLHLVRNAVDHGIEPAHERGNKPVPAEIVLSAEGHGDLVIVNVSDDGRGIDIARVRAVAIARGLAEPTTLLSEEAAHELLFAHGFSTRQDATNLSGRGVGLDAVRRRLGSIGGRVSVANNPGGGTRFSIYIPSSVFRERVLIADVGGALCALPARGVEAVVPIGSDMIESVGSTPLLRYRGEGIPFVPLPLFRGDAESTRAAIVAYEGRRWAVSLPDVVGDMELLRVPVDAAVASLGPFAASGTLDDGRLVLVVNLDALLSRPRHAAEVARAQIRARGRRRVLVVDDSPIVRDLLVELLSSVGLEVRSAGDGAAALELLAEQPADLIVSDVEMPIMDGFELLRQLRERSLRVPVVMVTTRGSVSDRAMAAELGADALIVKSEFENAHLLETVRRFVEIGA
ncbi:MAG TPA: response regulator [Kofleriaceae bacterium]|nr:response regulator [Kofleriaceae bacterium]